MAKYYEPTEDETKTYYEWVATRPLVVRAVAMRFLPWELYRMKSSGHRVTPYSFDEELDGRVTLTVAVTGRFNAVAFERRVFGISPDDLEPCEIPNDGEIVGAALTQEEAHEMIDEIRLRMRPDLWKRDPVTRKVRGS